MIYKIANGKQVKVSPSEVKKTIMSANGWTESEYKKNYDLFKNKLRAYEALMNAQGQKTEKQSPVEVLYKEAKTKTKMAKQGKSYNPSAKMKIVRKMPAMSITQGRKAAQRQGYVERRKSDIGKITDAAFQKFIESNPKAQEIANAIDDPIRRMQALAAYADEIHVALETQREQIESEAIPFGETFGSDIELDFDYSNYLDEN